MSTLKRPLFPDPGTFSLPLPQFSADPARLEAEVHDAVAALNRQAREFSSSRRFDATYFGWVARAETCALKQRAVEAHEAVWAATACLNGALESRAAGRFRKWIGAYLGMWLLLLALAGWRLKHCETQAVAPVFFGFDYWRYLMMGALGGIVIALWGLILHTVNLDFDRHFAPWYWFKPVLGAVMGLVAVVTVQAGFLAVGGQALPPPAAGKMVLYLLAFVAGFSERFFIGILDRVMTALLSSNPSPTSSPKSPPPISPSSETKPGAA